MKTKYLPFLGIILLGAGSAAAQTPSIQREVDVTRAYEPSVQNALKINIMPDMTDTVQMRPDHHYEITPHPLKYGFAVNPLTAARVAAVEETAALPFYAKLGAGYGLQSVADIRYINRLNDRTDFGAYASHYGRWGKIENDVDVKESATATKNRAGAFLDHRLANDFRIGAEATYDFRNATRYGYANPGEDPQDFVPWVETGDEYMKQWIQEGQFRFSAGHSFTNTDKVNFRINAGLGIFGDRFNYNQTAWDFGAAVGFRAGMDGTLTIDGMYSGWKGGKNFDAFSGLLGRAGLTYGFENTDFRIKLGIYAGFTNTKREDNVDPQDDFQGKFLPQISLEKDLAEKQLTAFLDLRSGITDNSYAALAKRNPYLYSGQYAPNTVSYNTRAGIKGVLGGALKYTVYGGYTMEENAAFWANAYNGFDAPGNGAKYPYEGNEGNVFTVLADDMNYFEAGLELKANILNAFDLTGGFNYYSYSPDTFDEAWGMPEIKAHFGATYNYRGKLYLNLGMEYIGKREMCSYLIAPEGNTVGGQVDLKIGADYFVSKQFGVFLNLNNLLNHNIYYFNHYRELGLNVMAGVKISF